MAFGIIEKPSKQRNVVTALRPTPVTIYPIIPPKLQD